MACDSYLIDCRALSLESVFIGDNKSKITTTHGIYYSRMSPRELLNAACIRYASTKEGRIQVVKELLGYYRKTPFIIAPFDLGVYPIMSSSHVDCVWIFNRPFKVNEYEKGRSKITFSDGTVIALEVSEYTLRKQEERLHTVLNTFRMIDLERRAN